ncbi:MAG: hypothetical protein CMF22_11605 [Idiomarinaceae bacterium]|nr:hypothetical protein [Idiomarinaceae bacterium]
MSDLHRFFDAMNAGDYGYVDRMGDDEVKKVSPFVMLMWMQGAKTCTAYHTIMTDMFCNGVVFSLNKHPRLLLKLFVAANSDMGDTRYGFVKPPKKEAEKHLKLIAHHYQVSLREAKDYDMILTDEDRKYLESMYGDIDI